MYPSDSKAVPGSPRAKRVASPSFGIEAPEKLSRTVTPSPVPDSVLEKFKQDVSTWFESLQKNLVQQKKLQEFLESDKLKLPKNENCLDELAFSILRLRNKDGHTVFRIVGHDVLGVPGTFGRIKLVFPLSYCLDSKRVEIRLDFPMALKIVRHGRIEQVAYRDATLPMYHLLQTMHPEAYAVISRETQSESSRYTQFEPIKLGGDMPYKAGLMSAEMQSNLKHYISMPLFPGCDLCTYCSELIKTGKKLEDREVAMLLTGILKEIKRVHGIGYVHRDIKLENILFDEATQTVSLIDFDFSVQENTDAKLAFTPTYWREDEIRRVRTDNSGIEYVTSYRDRYAFACVVRELLHVISDTSCLKLPLTNFVKAIIERAKDFSQDFLETMFAKILTAETVTTPVSSQQPRASMLTLVFNLKSGS